MGKDRRGHLQLRGDANPSNSAPKLSRSASNTSPAIAAWNPPPRIVLWRSSSTKTARWKWRLASFSFAAVVAVAAAVVVAAVGTEVTSDCVCDCAWLWL